MTNVNLGISVGDINGIGIEVILKTLKDKRISDFCTPIIFGSNKVISFHRKQLEIHDLNFNIINSIDKIKKNKINLYNIIDEDTEVNFGKKCDLAGKYALKSIQEACSAIKNKKIDVLVTAPINKYSIQKEVKSFIGHTEFLEANFNGKSLMIMISEFMKIAFVTGHIPLSKVATTITSNIIIEKTKQFNYSLINDFTIKKPKIAILAINPHAGENGLLGPEDKEIIFPAIKKLQEDEILAFGPYPADSFFTNKNLSMFDGVLSMYHDQGLIPFKTLAFSKGVNFTANLNIIRTSPVHGTGFDIAGKNIANESSFREAIFQAYEIFKNRKENITLSKNTLD